MSKGKKTKEFFEKQWNNQKDKKTQNYDKLKSFNITKYYINLMIVLLMLILILPNFSYFKNIITTI
jgi:uncharacterized membrane protein YukC